MFLFLNECNQKQNENQATPPSLFPEKHRKRLCYLPFSKEIIGFIASKMFFGLEKKIQRLFKAMIWLLLLFCQPDLFAKSLQVDVEASSAILMNAKTGAVLFEKNGDELAFPASLTKIATALFAIDEIGVDLKQVTRVSREALKMKVQSNESESLPYWLEKDGSSLGLKAGEMVSIESLLYGILLVSGNDAANVLAESQGSISQFMTQLNEYLQKKIGCSKSHFQNPHGLHHPDHQTTAYDMALIAKKALEIPLFRQIVCSKSYEIPKTDKQEPRVIHQTNRLLCSGRFFDARAIGVKTGYTSKASHTLVAAAQSEGRVLIAVILGSSTKEERYKDAIRLFNAAFSEKKMRTVFIPFGKKYKCQIKGAQNPLEAVLLSELALEYYPAEEPIVRAFLCWNLPPFPIKQRQQVAELRLIDEKGTVLQTLALVAKEDVRAHFLARLLGRLYRG